MSTTAAEQAAQPVQQSATKQTLTFAAALNAALALSLIHISEPTRRS